MIRLIGQDEDTVDLVTGASSDPLAELLGFVFFLGTVATLGAAGGLGFALVLGASWRVAIGCGLLGFVILVSSGLVVWEREHR
jgi:hypothetical protein